MRVPNRPAGRWLDDFRELNGAWMLWGMVRLGDILALFLVVLVARNEQHRAVTSVREERDRDHFSTVINGSCIAKLYAKIWGDQGVEIDHGLARLP